ncbi:MAG: 6-phosphofructokinase [Clostridia bacterium]|nr:6-phosphofructokinase [Clostridia bacterium]
MLKNAIVGQSGGPTAVINSSLAGVFQGCISRGADNVYGMINGIQGLLDNKTVNLTQVLDSSLEIELLKRTPSAYLGSCRYKLPHYNEDTFIYEKLFKILKDLQIHWFFYIGGNDSMDTICKLSDYAKEINSDIRFMGIPKTIDNDLILTDHTPGYGSAAKYVGLVMKEIIRDATVYGTQYVTVVEIMGRNAGWLTAAAALSKAEDCEGVDMLCLPEVPFNTDNFLTKTEKLLKSRKSIVIAVSEGIKLPDGRYVCELSDDARFTDAFGHKNLTGTARYLSNMIMKKLGTKSRSVELSTLQRCAGHVTSRTDITEAYQVGGAAAKYAFEGHTGEMIAIKRVSDDPYQSTTEPKDVHKVANLEKKIPLEWINESYTDIEPIFHQYARPLIQAELTPIFINGLPRHIYLKEL